MHSIYPEQWKTAKKVYQGYQTETRWQIVIAQTQSGKTGISKGVCHYFQESSLQPQIYYICGMNDKSLKTQQIREFKDLIPPDQILFQKDLERKIKHQTIYPRTSYFFILDESHYAQNTMSLVHKFFNELIKLRMDGNSFKAEEHQVYFLSISATPMSEIAQLLDPNQECSKRTMVYQPPDNYYGFQRMLDQDCLKSAFDLNEKGQQYLLVDLIKAYYHEQKKAQSFKYIIIRFVNTAKGIQNRQNILKQLGADLSHDFNYINYHSKDLILTNFNQQIKSSPPKLTIIGIYNSLRAGYQLDTTHIAMVHENPNADVDVTVQGLPGRCCGYQNKAKHKVQVYCNTEAIYQYLKMVNTDFDPQTIPKNCKNIKQAGPESNTPTRKKFENQAPKLIKVPSKLLKACQKFNRENPTRSAKTYQKFWEQFNNDFRTLCDADFWDQSQPARAGLMILDQRNKSSTKTNSWLKWWDPGYQAFTQTKAFNGFSNQNLVPSDSTESKIELKSTKIKLKSSLATPASFSYYRYIYLNLKPNHPQFGYLLLTSKRIRQPEEVNRVITTGQEQFHPENNQLLDQAPPIVSEPNQKIQLLSNNK
jgi:hypothetical protein